MKSAYDLIVIGAGSAGLSVSLFAGKVGLKTLLIDKTEVSFGGDCLNYGCVPSKALIHVSKIIHHAREAGRFGLLFSGKPDIGKVMQYVSEAQADIRQHENPEYLREQGIDVLVGTASFCDKQSVVVDNKIYTATNIVIATGSKPVHPPIPGIEKVHIIDNESLFSLKKLPSKILVIGAGPVGMEVSQALSRLHVKVVVAGRRTHILPHDPEEVTSVLKDQLVREGIVFHLGYEVREFISINECVLASEKDQRTETFDAVFLATGREINIDSLALAKAGVAMKDGYIVADQYLRTSNKNIFVCGDVAGKLKFSHAAEQHARILLNNFFSPFRKKLDNSAMSWVTFTDPQVASFGMNESEMNKRNIRFEKIVHEFAKDDRAVTDDYRYGKLILYVTTKNILGKQKILGGSVIAPHAGEMIQELLLCINASLSTDVLFDKIYPYPVASRVNQLAIVEQKEKTLTPFLKRILRLLYR